MSERSHRKDRTALIVSIAVSALGFVLLASYVREFQLHATGGAPVELLALRRDVSAGEPLEEQMLIVRTLPETYVESRHVLASDLPRVLGVRASLELESNQTLLWTDLTTAQRDRSSLSSRVPKGMRAMSIEHAGRRALGELLLPGDRVDVLLTKRKGEVDTRLVTVPLLQNALVLAVGNSIGGNFSDEPARRPGSVTLLLTVDQASLLAQAIPGGDLNLVVRNEDDLEVNEGLAETDDADVLEQEERARRQRRVRIERVN